MLDLSKWIANIDWNCSVHYCISLVYWYHNVCIARSAESMISQLVKKSIAFAILFMIFLEMDFNWIYLRAMYLLNLNIHSYIWNGLGISERYLDPTCALDSADLGRLRCDWTHVTWQSLHMTGKQNRNDYAMEQTNKHTTTSAIALSYILHYIMLYYKWTIDCYRISFDNCSPMYHSGNTAAYDRPIYPI